MTWTSKQLEDFFEVVTPDENEYPIDAMGVELEIEYESILGTTRRVEEFFRACKWKNTADNSLRGLAVEHVSPPKTLEELHKDLLHFDSLLDNYYRGVALKPSHRCSTHVHLNFSNSGVTDILKFSGLFYLFEPLLAKLAGPDRTSNCFCVTSKTIPLVISDNIAFKKPFYKGADNPDMAKYASLNFCRLKDLGTIEVRLMRGYEKSQRTVNWLMLLNDLKQSARNRFASLEDIEEKYLQLPYKDFVEYVFPNISYAIYLAAKGGVVNLKSSLAEGYRTAFPLLQTSLILQEGVAALEKFQERKKKQEEARADSLQEAFNKLRAQPKVNWDVANWFDQYLQGEV